MQPLFDENISRMEGRMSEGLLWEKVVFRQGDGRYEFSIDRGGLHATLETPHGRSLTIPMVAWYGLLDALAAARRTKTRAERPAATRHGQRWSEAEAEELAASFRSGVSAESLARRHNRSRVAVETQLSKAGLWDREIGVPTPAATDPLEHLEVPDDGAPPWSPEPGREAAPTRRSSAESKSD